MGSEFWMKAWDLMLNHGGIFLPLLAFAFFCRLEGKNHIGSRGDEHFRGTPSVRRREGGSR